MGSARQSDSRFGFGHAVGVVGPALIGVGVSQPWVKLDLDAAFSAALKGKGVTTTIANDILYVGSNLPVRGDDRAPAIVGLSHRLGIETTGWAQERYAAIALLVLAVIALTATLRSVFASTAWEARAGAPFLAIVGFGTIALALVEYVVLAPEPRTAMRPDTGLWLVGAGGILTLLGALTLGSNRRRPFMDDDAPPPITTREGGDHLVYAHGAWVPVNPDTKQR